MTQRRWGLVLARAVVVGLARFPLLLLPVDSDRAVWLLVVAALPTAVSGYVGMALLPKVTGDRHHLGPVPATTRAWGRYSLVNWASTLTYQAPTFADAGHRARERRRRPERQLLRRVGRRRARLLRPDGHRAGAARRGRPRRRPPPQPGAPGHRRRRRPDGGRGGRRHPRARPDRHPLRRGLPGRRRRAAAARGRRHPLGGDIRLPHRGPGAAPQRGDRAHHRRAVARDPRPRARARARGRDRRRGHRLPRPATSSPRSCALGTHVQGRRTAEGPIPLASPDDFEPEDAVWPCLRRLLT